MSAHKLHISNYKNMILQSDGHLTSADQPNYCWLDGVRRAPIKDWETGAK